MWYCSRKVVHRVAELEEEEGGGVHRVAELEEGGGGGGGGWCLETVDLELVLLGQPTLDQQLADVLPLVALNKN